MTSHTHVLSRIRRAAIEWLRKFSHVHKWKSVRFEERPYGWTDTFKCQCGEEKTEYLWKSDTQKIIEAIEGKWKR